MRRPWLGLAIALGVLLAPAGLGQADEQAPSDTVALTAQEPNDASAPQTDACPTLNLYEMVPLEDKPAQSGKAYLTRTSAVVACRTQFFLAPPGAFNLTGPATANLVVGCEEPTVFLAGFPDVSLELNRNGEAITGGAADLGNTCSPDEPIEAEISMDPPEEPAFAPEDTLRLNVSVFGSPGWVSENVHLLVGGNETASTLTLPQLSQAYAIDEPEPTDAPDNGTTTTNDTLERSSTDPSGEENGTPGPGVGVVLVGLALVALGRAGTLGR